MQRHLAALKTGTPRIALARFLALVSRARSLAELRADAAADAHLAVARAARRPQIRQVTDMLASIPPIVGTVFAYSTTTTRWRTLWIMPRTDGVSSRSTTCCMRRNPRPRIVCAHVPGAADEADAPTSSFNRSRLLLFRHVIRHSRSPRFSALALPPSSIAVRPPWLHPSGASSASKVALITLCGFEVPIDLVSTLEIPATSITARTGPPAMIPVPSEAGLSSTCPEP